MALSGAKRFLAIASILIASILLLSIFSAPFRNLLSEGGSIIGRIVTLDDSERVNSDKLDALDTLESLDGADTDPLKDAIKELKKSVDSDYWLDSRHVVCQNGTKAESMVFDSEKRAVGKLIGITPEDELGRYDDVQRAILKMVSVDKMLANTLVGETQAGKERTEALKAMTEGNKKTEEGDYGEAISHYKRAWQQAKKVAPSCK